MKEWNPKLLELMLGVLLSKLIHLFFNYQPGLVSLELTQNICEGREFHVNILTNKRLEDKNSTKVTKLR